MRSSLLIAVKAASCGPLTEACHLTQGCLDTLLSTQHTQLSEEEEAANSY